MSIALVCYILLAIFSSQYGLVYMVQIPFFIGAILDISWLYQGIEDFKYVVVRNTIIKFASVALIFLLVKDRNDLVKYLLIMGLSQVVGNIPMWVRLPKEVQYSRICFANMKKHLAETIIYFVPAIATQIYSVLDKAMLGMLGGIEEENGYYEQAHKIISMTISLVSSYTIVMRSRISYLFGKSEESVIKYEISKTLRFICFLVFPMAFGLAGVARNMVPWFLGTGYDKVVYLIYIFCPMYIFLGIDTCLGTNVLLPSGQQNKSSIGQIIGAFLNLVLNAILIPRLYSIGAAIASVTTELVIFIILLYYSRNYVKATELIKMSQKYFFAGLTMFFPVFWLSGKISASLFCTIVLIVIGIAIYSGVLLIVRDEFVYGILLSSVNRCKKIFVHKK